MSVKENKELSDRELEIIQLIVAGASNKEIAKQLVISTNTVKVHLRNIFDKIDVSSRTEAAMYAVTNGLVEKLASPSEESWEKSSVNTYQLDKSESTPDSQTLYSKKVPRAVAYALGIFGLIAVVLLFSWLSDQSSIKTVEPTAQPLASVSQRWRRLSDLSTPRSNFAITVFENKIYAIAGETDYGITARVEQYDPIKDKWTFVTEKPLPVADVSAAVVGGLIYIPGGRTESGNPTDQLEVYDPRENSWKQKARLPEPLSAYALSSFEGRLYTFGGWNGTEFVNSVYEYDPIDDHWTKRTPMTTARGFAGAVESGGQIFVMGGYNGDNYLTVNEVYSPSRDGAAENPWFTAAPLPEARCGFGIANLADVIYLVGGVSKSSEVPKELIYLPQEDEWRSLELVESKIGSYLGMVPMGLDLFAVGGKVDEMVISENQVYQAMYTMSIPVIIK